MREANHIPFTTLCAEAVEPIYAGNEGVIYMYDADDFGHNFFSGIIAGITELGVGAPIQTDIASDTLFGEVGFAIYVFFG